MTDTQPTKVTAFRGASFAFLAIMLAASGMLSPSTLVAQESKLQSPQSDSTRFAELPSRGSFKPFSTGPLEAPPVIPNRALKDTSALGNEAIQKSRDPSSLTQYPLSNATSTLPSATRPLASPNRPTPLRQPYQAHLRDDRLRTPSATVPKTNELLPSSGTFRPIAAQASSLQTSIQEEVDKKSVLANGAKVFNAPHQTTVPSASQPSPQQETPTPRQGQFLPSDGTILEYDDNADPYTGDLNLVRPPSPANQLGSHAQPRPSSKPGQPQIPNEKQFWEQFPKVAPDDPKTRTAGYDSPAAVLNNGFWFAGIDTLYFEPMFQDNNAFIRTSGTNSTAEKVDFGFNNSFRGYFGFETNAGPAVKLTFTRINEFSNLNEFTFSATDTAVTQIDLGTSDSNFLFGDTAAAGSRLSIRQQIKTNITDIAFFKDQKNPVSRVRGNVGLRHVSLQQQLFAGLDDPINGSSQARNFNDYFAVGPRFGIEYFRPIGHTDLELQSGFFGSLLFGRRDQTFTSTGSSPLTFRQLGKVEPMSIFDLYVGVQWNIKVSKCQRVYLRTAIESQLWAGSDTALDIGSDLGLYGMTFGFGITR